MDDYAMSIYKRFGKMIQSFREARGMSQNDVARILKMPKSTYGNYERGERKVPLPDLLLFSKFYGFDLNEFIKETSELIPVEHRRLRWETAFKGIVFTDDEIEELICYAKYLITKRTDKK